MCRSIILSSANLPSIPSKAAESQAHCLEAVLGRAGRRGFVPSYPLADLCRTSTAERSGTHTQARMHLWRTHGGGCSRKRRTICSSRSRLKGLRTNTSAPAERAGTINGGEQDHARWWPKGIRPWWASSTDGASWSRRVPLERSGANAGRAHHQCLLLACRASAPTAMVSIHRLPGSWPVIDAVVLVVKRRRGALVGSLTTQRAPGPDE